LRYVSGSIPAVPGGENGVDQVRAWFGQRSRELLGELFGGLRSGGGHAHAGGERGEIQRVGAVVEHDGGDVQPFPGVGRQRGERVHRGAVSLQADDGAIRAGDRGSDGDGQPLADRQSGEPEHVVCGSAGQGIGQRGHAGRDRLVARDRVLRKERTDHLRPVPHGQLTGRQCRCRERGRHRVDTRCHEVGQPGQGVHDVGVRDLPEYVEAGIGRSRGARAAGVGEGGHGHAGPGQYEVLGTVQLDADLIGPAGRGGHGRNSSASTQPRRPALAEDPHTRGLLDPDGRTPLPPPRTGTAPPHPRHGVQGRHEVHLRGPGLAKQTSTPLSTRP
jgi:hypothetical protein